MSHQNLPLFAVPAVYHFGSMNAEDKGASFAHSLEGHGLSVSTCPHAWQSIARLGGSPLWKMEREGGVFVGMHELRDKAKLWADIREWGIGLQLCEPVLRWRAWSTDEEGELRYSLHATKEEADLEADEECQETEDNSPVEILVPTEQLAKLMGHTMPDEAAADQVAMMWIEAHYPEIDGVWWREEYAPESLSAPRGAIFRHRMASWECAQTDIDLAIDQPKIKPLKGKKKGLSIA